MKNPLKRILKPKGGDGVSKSGEGGSGGGWTISPGMLGDVDQVQRLFAVACGRGWVRDVDRLRFFAAARSVFRRASGDVAGESIENPGGTFTRLVKRRLWLGSEADEAWAREAIRKLERLPELPRTAALDQADGGDVDAARREQIAALLQKCGSG